MQIWRQAALAAIVFCLVPRPATAAPAPQTKQQIYDAAQKAFDAEDWPAAIAGFVQVAGPATNPSPSHAQALIHARLAQAYVATDQYALAAASAQLATNALTAPADTAEAVNAWTALGDARRGSLEMAGAIDAYSHALALTPDTPQSTVPRAIIQLGIAQAAMVTDPARAAATLAAVAADPVVSAKLTPMLRAQLEMLRGRAALNLGDPRAAKTFLDAAIDHSGGAAGTRVNQTQVAVRSDMAIVYFLLDNDLKLHDLLAHTGAGHIGKLDWLGRSKVGPPTCDGDVLRPDDTAVVEVAIAPDGRVIKASPIYASRHGPTGVAFAKAATKWRFDQAGIASLAPFWRVAMRFQLRCLDSPELMSLTTNVVANAGRWLVAHGASPADVAPLYNAEIADNDPRLARDDVSGIAAQYRWIEQGGGDRHDAQREARLDRLIGGPAGSPDLRAMVVVAGLSSNAKTRQRGAQDRAAELAAALVDFDAAWPSSYAGAWLRLEYALQLEKSRQFDLAKPQLDRVLALPVSVLPADDVVRTVATLHRAMLDRRAGNAAAAESRVAAAGMSPEQCALVDVRPVMTRAGVGSNDFPQDAFDWGFEGYVGYAFDINAAGEVVNARTVFAYPPFVFNAATEKTVRRFRYLPPVIGGEAVGCNQKIDAVRYQK